MIDSVHIILNNHMLIRNIILETSSKLWMSITNIELRNGEKYSMKRLLDQPIVINRLAFQCRNVFSKFSLYFLFFFRLKIKIENSAPIFEINLELIGKMASDLVPSGFLSYGQLKTKCKYEKSNFLFDIKK